jgi:hypothetical protein
MKKDSPLIFIIIVIVILTISVFGVIYLQNVVPDPVKEGASQSTSAKAVTRCEEVIKAGLRNAAKSKLTGQKVTDLGNSRFQVTGYVDGPNASGIIVRGNYNCIFNFNSKAFDMLSLEGDDVWKPLKK